MGKVIKSAFVLFTITLIAGFLMGWVHEITKEPIAAAKESRRQEAYKSVFPEASSYTEAENFDADEASSVLSEAGYEKDTINGAAKAVSDDGSLMGYIISVISSEGYGGNIEFQIGVKMDGSITGIVILNISETAGLGMNAEKQEFRSQYVGKNVTEFSVTKIGATDDSEINAISGATITSRAMTNGVNAGLAYFAGGLGGEGGE